GVPGMIYMSSTSANDGSSNITVSFDVGYPIDIAAVDVQNRVSAATAQLPAIVNQGGVTVQKKNPNLTLAVNLYSPDGSVDLVTLSNYAYLQLVDPLKRITGVGDVQIFGERRYSMRVWLDPDKLAKLGVTAVDVQNAIAEQNIQVAAGKIGGSPAPAGTMFSHEWTGITYQELKAGAVAGIVLALAPAFAFILGVAPLMVASGAGAASRQSIGTTVLGGMLVATLLSLACVPVFYAVIERLREGRSSAQISLARNGSVQAD